ncbi:MAG: hypothetical protein KFH87_11030 [Bacteroidetes bacterium]|nr:hypothetical protein [Bacteroidota bacterium]
MRFAAASLRPDSHVPTPTQRIEVISRIDSHEAAIRRRLCGVPLPRQDPMELY